MSRKVQLVGKVYRKDAEVMVIIKVNGKYYPATEQNATQFEAYIKTGDEIYLLGLNNELEIDLL